MNNQELLKELERKLPEFTEEEIRRLLELALMNTPSRYKEKLLSLDPQQMHDGIKESIQQEEKEKKDKEQVKLIKEFFEKKKQ